MYILAVIILIAILALIVWDKFLDKKETEDNSEDLRRLQEELSQVKTNLELKDQKLGEMTKALEKEAGEKNEMSGKNKQMFARLTSLEKDYSLAQQQLLESKEKIVANESLKTQREKEFDKKVSDLESSRRSLEEEKIRVQKEEELKRQQEEELRNRIWNEHENKAIAKLKELCQKPAFAFPFFENTVLPDSFDGKLKPDFLVDFMGQYIIFDAKMTKPDSANSLLNYLKAQVKSTAKKIKESKNSEEIFKTVFFVVPDLADLKETSFFEEGYEFYAVSLESLEPILAAYKKISYYENIEQIDPKERENIVQLIAAYDQQISHQNAVNILSSVMGLKVAQLKTNLNTDLQTEVLNRKKKMRIENFKPTDLKRLVENPEEQVKEMKKLVEVKEAPVKAEELKAAQDSLF
jgi:hypothetical protein